MSRISYSSAPMVDDDEIMLEKEAIVGKDVRSSSAAVCEVEEGDAGSPTIFRAASRPSSLTTAAAAAAAQPPRPTVTSAPVQPARPNGTLAPQSSAVPNTFCPSNSVDNISSSSSGHRAAPLKISSPTSPLDSIKSWSSNALVYARQYVGEHLGRRGRSTTDPDITTRVTAVLEQQRQYMRLLRLATALAVQTEQVVRTEKALSDALAELSQCGGNVALGEQFSCSADTMKLVSKNGDALLVTLNAFKQSLTTLCNTTIEDTLTTVKSCDRARIKYDAYRLRVEDLKMSTGSARDVTSMAKLREAESAFQLHKQKYDRIHGDLVIKLKFLEENKVMVCQKHLFLLHKAFMSYVSGNHRGVDDILKRCHFTAAAAITPIPSIANNDQKLAPSLALPSTDNREDPIEPISSACS